MIIFNENARLGAPKFTENRECCYNNRAFGVCDLRVAVKMTECNGGILCVLHMKTGVRLPK